MQKWGGWVQIACKIAYVLNGRPLTSNTNNPLAKYRNLVQYSVRFCFGSCYADLMIPQNDTVKKRMSKQYHFLWLGNNKI